MTGLRDTLEGNQIAIYFAAIGAAALIALTLPGTTALEVGINPALALMLFVTFLQVPLPELGRAFTRVRFLAALLVTNFVVLPILVAGLIQFLPANPMLRLGVLMVLLTPCIDYVVTFAHLGRADAKVLLASTPALLIAQMLLLPIYLNVFLGEDAARFVQVGPFVHAFVWLIAVPLGLAAAVQIWAGRRPAGQRVITGLGLLPVPATALVLFVVIASVLPQLGPALDDALRVVPVYVAFAVAAPLDGLGGRARVPPRRPHGADVGLQRRHPQLPGGPAAGLRRPRRRPAAAGRHRHPDAGRARERARLRPCHAQARPNVGVAGPGRLGRPR